MRQRIDGPAVRGIVRACRNRHVQRRCQLPGAEQSLHAARSRRAPAAMSAERAADTRRTSAVAVWRSSASCVSLNSRAFWIAITAWSAKVLSSAISLSANCFGGVAQDDDRSDAAALPQHRRSSTTDTRRPLDTPAHGAGTRSCAAMSGCGSTCRCDHAAVTLPRAAIGNVRAIVARARTAPGRHVHLLIALDEQDPELLGGEQPLAALEDLVEHRLRVRRPSWR